MPVPVPPVTVHVCEGDDGWVPTVTAYAAPLASAVLNLNAPLALTTSVSLPFFSVSPVPESPVTVPPIVKVA